VVLAHGVAAGVVGALVERGDDVVRAADVAGVVVVLVAELPDVGKLAVRQVVLVDGLDVGAVVDVGGRVARHRRADDGVLVAVPPVPGGLAGAHVGGVVVGDDAATVADVVDDRVPLVGVEELPRLAAGARPVVGDVEEDDRVVLGEVLRGEDPRVLVGVLALARAGPAAVAVLPVDLEADVLEGVLEHRAALVDRLGVAVAGRPGVDQDLLALALGVRGSGRGRRGRDQHRERQEQRRAERDRRRDAPGLRREPRGGPCRRAAGDACGSLRATDGAPLTTFELRNQIAHRCTQHGSSARLTPPPHVCLFSPGPGGRRPSQGRPPMSAFCGAAP